MPLGTRFVEVNACVGWEGPVGAEAIELTLVQDGSIFATAVDNSDDIGSNVDALTHLKAIVTTNANAHHVYQLFARAAEGSPVAIEGPCNANTISYGTP
ncbi:hypothetical protein [Cohnella sp.]|uniref:hypothetical protein n=1 Tax=Cohnella sp. TaxID=1883426 RepID=UPI00356428C9